MSNPYIPNDTAEIQEKLLSAIGITAIAEVFKDIPLNIRLTKELSLPSSTPEVQVSKIVEGILQKNTTAKDYLSFLGGGAWHHYVPAPIDALALRGEYLTSYTPYQPEISQGLLQTLFEYQSMMAELLAMDVVNASMYDWASALGEAARMASRITRRNEFIVPRFLCPERFATLKAYLNPLGIKIREVQPDLPSGQIDFEDLEAQLSSQTAGIYFENPSYLGYLVSHLEDVAQLAHDQGSLFIVGVDPISLGIIKPPGEYGADIVIGEGQALGNYVNYGGPFLGIFACKNESRLIRQLPGRLIGMTSSQSGLERGFAMVLQTREQHIRREKATSNICTNHALCAARAAIYMALLGHKGFRQLGEYLLTLTHYAIQNLSTISGLQVPRIDACHFKDFTIAFPPSMTSNEVNRELLTKGILGGRTLSDFSEFGDLSLFSVTEMHTMSDIDYLCESLKAIVESQ